MGPAEVISFIIQVLSQLGLLPIIQGMAVVLAAAAIIHFFIGRRG